MELPFKRDSVVHFVVTKPILNRSRLVLFLHKTSICLSVITWCYDTSRELIASPSELNLHCSESRFQPFINVARRVELRESRWETQQKEVRGGMIPILRDSDSLRITIQSIMHMLELMIACFV